MQIKEEHKNRFYILFAVLLILDFVIFFQIYKASAKSDDLKIYFLNIGQGDSELAVLPGGVKVLIDGGPPNGKLLEELGKVLPMTDRYVDLVMMSHPQLDHFGGFIDLFHRYRVGAFLTNGREGTALAFNDLKKAIKQEKVRSIVLAKGDKIKYKDSVINLLSPDTELLKSKELNDTCLVAELLSKNSRVLFTGDIGVNVEDKILSFYREHLDILKVAHHGSKFSSSAEFLKATSPTIAFIEVGKNTYGHPTKEVLGRLEDSGAKIFRTDRDGTMEAIVDGQNIRIFKNVNIE